MLALTCPRLGADEAATVSQCEDSSRQVLAQAIASGEADRAARILEETRAAGEGCEWHFRARVILALMSGGDLPAADAEQILRHVVEFAERTTRGGSGADSLDAATRDRARELRGQYREGSEKQLYAVLYAGQVEEFCHTLWDAPGPDCPLREALWNHQGQLCSAAKSGPPAGVTVPSGKWRAQVDLYLRLSTGLRVGGVRSGVSYDEWSLGIDLGVGVRCGPLHAGIAAGARSQALAVVALMLLAAAGDSGATGSSDSEAGWELYGDFPVRLYFGLRVPDSREVRLDVFWGGYARASGVEDLPSTRDFEAGAAIQFCWLLLEASYVWPQSDMVRITLGVDWLDWAYR